MRVKQLKSLLGVDADDKTRVLDDSGVVGKVLESHNVLQEPFWISDEQKQQWGCCQAQR